MKKNCDSQEKIQSISIHLCQMNSSYKYKNFVQNLHRSEENLQSQTQKLCSSKICLQKANLDDSRELFLKSRRFQNTQDDSKINIQDEDTQETLNSINSILTKSSNANPQKPNKNIQKQYFNLKNYYQSSQQKTNQTSALSISSIEIQKFERSLSNYKEKNFLLELPLNQSKSFLGDDQLELEHDHASNNSPIHKIEKTDSFILKSSLQKRVTFQDITCSETYQSSDESVMRQLLQLYKKQETKMSDLESLDSGRKTNKSILKRHYQEFQLNSVEQKNVEDAFQINLSDKDFCDIRENELIQHLIEKENCNKIFLKEYFFSELVTKISSNGEKKKKIIFMTRKHFYVLQDLYSPNHVQKFCISEINKIIIHSYYKNVCSIIIGNTFQLNLQINHFNEFITFIKDVFKNVLNNFLPIVQKQNLLLKEEHKIDSKIYNNQSKMESFLRCQKKEFYIQIQQISSNNMQNFESILGLLQFFQSDICITALSKSQELNKLIQVVLLHKDLVKKSFVFKSLKHSDQIFLVKLQDEKDFPHFLDAIESIYNKKKEIK
ncbi:hypothetical protein ABPG72_011361 [Tetrahymena utriculariae]